jgi:hypothetical protein
MGGASKFADVNPNQDNSGSVTSPIDTLRILFTMMLIADNPSLGIGPASDVGDTGSDGRGGGKISLRRNGTENYIRDAQGFAPRLETYVEYIYAPGSEELRGWRFVFQAVDELHFSFDLALTKLFIRLRAEMSKRGAKLPFDPKGPITPFTSEKDWVSHGLSGYARERFWCTDEATEALSMDLTNPDNPARCSNVFTFEYSRLLINDAMNVDPIYRVDYFAVPEDQGRELAQIQGIPLDESQNEDSNTQDYFRSRYAGATDSPEDEVDVTSIDDRSTSRIGGGLSSLSKVALVFPNGAAHVHSQRRAPMQFFGFNCMSAPRAADPTVVEGLEDESIQFIPSSGHMVNQRRSDRMNIETAAKRMSTTQSATQYFRKLKEKCMREAREAAEAKEAVARRKGGLGLGTAVGLGIFPSQGRSTANQHLRSYVGSYGAEMVAREDDIAAFGDMGDESSPRPQTRRPSSSSSASQGSSSASSQGSAASSLPKPTSSSSGYGNMSDVEVDGMRRYMKELCNDESKAMINAVLNSDTECPATGVAHRFIQKKVNESKNQSLIRPCYYLIDKELTTFGNFVAYDMFNFDHLYTLTSLHQELHFMQISSLQAFDITSKDRMHILLSGIPASGKSFIMKVQEEDLSIRDPSDPTKGLVISISVQSKRAMTTDENLNGFRIYIDEANANVVGKGDDGTGVQEMKEILTTGKLTTERCYWDGEQGKSISIKTTTFRMSQHMCGTNVPFWQIKKETEAIYSRFAKVTVPIREILGKDATEASYRIRRLDAAKEMTTRFQDMWHTRQGISAIIYALIRVEAIPQIDITIVEKLMPIVNAYLKSIGFAVHLRDNLRIHLHCQTIVMYHAINMVFFTDRHFQEGTPWSLDQVIACVPYLTSTREQFWFGFSQMFQTFVNPFMDNILDAIYKIIKAEDTDDQYSVQIQNARQTKDPNYNYYLLNVANQRAHDEDCFQAAAKVIARRIVTTGELQLNEGNVEDFLKWMEGQYIEAPFYTQPVPTVSTDQPANMALRDDEVSSTHTIPVIKELRNGSRIGLEISTHFLEQKRSQRYLNILEMCIRKTMEPLSPGQAPRRIILAETLRMEAPSLRKAWSKRNQEQGYPPHPLDSGQAQAPMVDGRARKVKKDQYHQQPNFFHCIVEGPEIDPKTGKPRTEHVQIANDRCIPRSLRFMLRMFEVENTAEGRNKADVAIEAAEAMAARGDDEADNVERTVSAKTLDTEVFQVWCKKIGFDPAQMPADTPLRVAYMSRGEYPYNFQEHGCGASERNVRARTTEADVPRTPVSIVGEVHDLSEADDDVDEDEVEIVDDPSGDEDEDDEDM